ncbi:MAG: hypothetical protein WBU92_00810, partial [Candidatus Dormiibacterota bacterium]
RLQRRELDASDLVLSELSSRLRARVEREGAEVDLLWAAESLRELTRLMELKLGRFGADADEELPGTARLAEPEPDPALRLEEYRLFKAAAEVLLADAGAGPKAFLRVLGVPVEPRPTIRLNPELLATAFGSVLARLPQEVTLEPASPRYSIERRAAELLELIRQRTSIVFDEVFRAAADRLEAVVLFMALLDLLSKGLAVCEQEAAGAEIRVELAGGG